MSNTAPLFAIGDEVVFNQCGRDFKAVVRGASVNGSVLVQLKDSSHWGHSGLAERHPESTPVDGTRTYWYVDPPELRHVESGVVAVSFNPSGAQICRPSNGKMVVHCLADGLTVTPAQRKTWVKWESCNALLPARVAVKLAGCENVLRHTPHYNYASMGLIFLSFDEGNTYQKYAFDDVYVETTA